MKPIYVLMVVSAFLMSGLAGCGTDNSLPAAGSVTTDGADASLGEAVDTPETDSETANNSGEPEQPSADSTKKDAVSVVIASWKETQEFIAKQKGKVVVLDAWSTSCLPCIKELPNLVALQKRYPKRVVCVTMSLDYYGAKDIPPEASKEDVLKVLRKVNSTMRNVISSTADEKFYEAVDLVSIPAVFVYGPDGKLSKRFDNEDEEEYGEEGFTYEKHIVPLVEELLSGE